MQESISHHFQNLHSWSQFYFLSWPVRCPRGIQKNRHVKVFNLLLNHSWQFLLIAVGIFIIVYALGKFIPDPFKFLIDLMKILVGEFTKKERIPAERMDALIVLGFLITTLLCAVCEFVPSVYKQLVGSDVPSGKTETQSYFLPCLIFFFITAILSPVWIYILQREQRLLRRAENALATTEQGQPEENSDNPS